MDKRIYIHKEEIQIVFKSDPELKDKALEKAKHEGMTLKAVLCMAMRAYVNDELVMGMWHKIERYEKDDVRKNEKSPPKKTLKKKKKKALTKKENVSGKKQKSDFRQYPVQRRNKKEVV